MSNIATSSFINPTIDWMPDEYQLEGIRVDGNALLLAGPGAGKTELIARRVQHLVVEKRVPISDIRLVTFSRKSALEMKNRMIGLLPTVRATDVVCSTIHSLAFRIVRQVHGPRFDVIDDEQKQRSLMKKAASEARARISSDRDLVSLYNRFVNSDPDESLEKLAAIVQTAFPRWKGKVEKIAACFEAYRQLKKRRAVIDYNDFLLLSIQSLKADSRLRRQYTTQHLLIDEVQDMSALQWRFLELLATEDSRIFAVGDAAQAIYGFQGASADGIPEFLIRHPETKVFHLPINRRSTKEIIKVANAILVACDTLSQPQSLEHSSPGERPQVVYLWDLHHQAKWIAGQIKTLVAGGVPWSQIAVLYRIESHIVDLKKEFDTRAISYSVRADDQPGDKDSPEGQIEASEKVYVGTIHSAKGLQFAAVFLLSVVDDFLLLTRFDQKEVEAIVEAPTEELREELRVFYVALTRAQRLLYLCVPKQSGGHELTESSFLKWILPALLEKITVSD